MSNIEISKTKYRLEKNNSSLFYDQEEDALLVMNKEGRLGLKDIPDLIENLENLLKFINKDE